ncbi:hypothetical protein HC762_01030 [bacterium]|nr:hypothetical protein [bacterium]
MARGAGVISSLVLLSFRGFRQTRKPGRFFFAFYVITSLGFIFSISIISAGKATDFGFWPLNVFLLFFFLF